MVTCPKCAAENRGNRTACWNCWSPLDDTGPGGARERVRVPGVSVRVPWPLLALLLLVAAAGAVGYLYLFTSRPEQVAANYADAVLNGLEARRDLFVTQDSQGQPLLTGVLTLASLEADPTANVAGDEATVSATATLTIDGDKVSAETAASALTIMNMLNRKFPMDIVLVKEGSQWKVDQARTRDSLLGSASRAIPPHLQSLLRGNTIPKVLPPAPGATPTPGQPAAAPGQPASAPTAPNSPPGPIRLGG